MQIENLVLGKVYQDTVSGWKGIATARYEYMNGCNRVELSFKDKDGVPTGYVFDIQQLESVPEEAPKVDEPKPTGGARDSTPVSR